MMNDNQQSPPASESEPDLPPKPAEDPIPLGVWVRIALPDYPDFIGFTYVDRQAGPSAQRGPQPDAPEAPGVIVRLSGLGLPLQVLDAAEVERLGLPAVPSWVSEFYGPQPEPGTLWGLWRQHPGLRGRFHADHPDDAQVMVHDGGPRMTDAHPEVVWVSVTGVSDDVFSGRVLNNPHHLVSVSRGSEIHFIIPEGGDYPLMVTEQYLREREHWEIIPCNRCGLSELLDAPSDLMRVVFPQMQAGPGPQKIVSQMFTVLCGNCGGLLVVRSKTQETEPGLSPIPGKKWWQFWK
jgi:hypothetical protein